MTDTPDLISAGEAVIDMIPEGEMFRPVPGGAAFNSARAAARLGVSVGYLGALSRDALGMQMAALAEADGVDLRGTLRSDRPTPISVLQMTGGDARYAIHHRDTAGECVAPDTLPRPEGMKALLLGGFSLIHPPGADAFERLGRDRPTGTVLYLDLNIRPGLITAPDAYRARLVRLLAVADIVKVSDEDMEWFGEDPSLAAPGALVLRTHGADGATAQLGETGITVPAPEVEVVDTVGAGDVFNAAWLAHGVQRGPLVPTTPAEVRTALKFAVTAASLSTENHGATGPTREEITCAL